MVERSEHGSSKMAITPSVVQMVFCDSKNARIPSPHDVFKSRIQMSSQKGPVQQLMTGTSTDQKVLYKP